MPFITTGSPLYYKLDSAIDAAIEEYGDGHPITAALQAIMLLYGYEQDAQQKALQPASHQGDPRAV